MNNIGIWSRIKNIVGAKVERAVSAAESQDPAGIVKSQLQKAKVQLGEFEQAVTEIGATKIGLEKDKQRLEADVKKWQGNAENAVEAGDDKLAAKALERKTQISAELEGVKTSLSKITERFETMKNKVIERKKLIQQKSSELKSLEARQKAAKLNKQMSEKVASFEGNGDALDQIDLMSQKVEDMENQVEAQEDLVATEKGEDLDSQFAEMESQSAVDDDLAALKAKMKKKKK